MPAPDLHSTVRSVAKIIGENNTIAKHLEESDGEIDNLDSAALEGVYEMFNDICKVLGVDTEHLYRVSKLVSSLILAALIAQSGVAVRRARRVLPPNAYIRTVAQEPFQKAQSPAQSGALSLFNGLARFA